MLILLPNSTFNNEYETRYVIKRAISISGVKAEPGTKKIGILRVPELLPDGSDVEIPFLIFKGVDDDPWLHTQVAQHGIEVHAL